MIRVLCLNLYFEFVQSNRYHCDSWHVSNQTDLTLVVRPRYPRKVSGRSGPRSERSLFFLTEYTRLLSTVTHTSGGRSVEQKILESQDWLLGSLKTLVQIDYSYKYQNRVYIVTGVKSFWRLFKSLGYTPYLYPPYFDILFTSVEIGIN